ncbi:MAG: hypothetical protein ACKVQA_02880, partial [Burkholderiales bacterium]
LDNVSKAHYDGDVQLYGTQPFRLRFSTEPNIETSALPLDYREGITVNGVGAQDAPPRLFSRMMAFFGLKSGLGKLNAQDQKSELVTSAGEMPLPENALAGPGDITVERR